MSGATNTHSDIGKWDAGLTEFVVDLTRPIVKRYFRAEVTGMEKIPPGPSLVVSNHSGGIVTPDMSVFAVAYYAMYGYKRPLYTLGHDMLFRGPAAELLKRTGVVRATPRTPQRGWRPAPLSWSSPAGITTCTGRRCGRTSLASAAELAMSPPPSRRECRSFPRYRSEPRRASST